MLIDALLYFVIPVFIIKAFAGKAVSFGDAFFAGLLYAYHEGKSLPDMLRYASASARFNLRHPTANLGAPTLAEIEAYIASPGFPVPR